MARPIHLRPLMWLGATVGVVAVVVGVLAIDHLERRADQPSPRPALIPLAYGLDVDVLGDGPQVATVADFFRSASYGQSRRAHELHPSRGRAAIRELGKTFSAPVRVTVGPEQALGVRVHFKAVHAVRHWEMCPFWMRVKHTVITGQMHCVAPVRG